VEPHTNEETAILSIENALKAVQMIPSNMTGEVSFFGGEPLLVFPRIKEIIHAIYSLKREESLSFHMTTNATLMTESIIQFLADNNFSLIISLDGPAHLHNENRPCANGNPSHAQVIEKLPILAKYKTLARRTTLRGTFEGSNPSVCERVRYLNEIAEKYGFGGVSVEPADIGEGCAKNSVNPIRPSDALVNEYYETAKWYANEIKNGRQPKFHHFDLRIARLRKRKPAGAECGAGVGYMTVTPDGTLYACHRCGNSAIGTVDTGINYASQSPWRDNRYYARESCPDCYLRNICGGGCRWTSRERFGDCRKADATACFLTDVCVRCAAWIISEIDNK